MPRGRSSARFRIFLFSSFQKLNQNCTGADLEKAARNKHFFLLYLYFFILFKNCTGPDLEEAARASRTQISENCRQQVPQQRAGKRRNRLTHHKCVYHITFYYIYLYISFFI
jgi:hypothetical protein